MSFSYNVGMIGRKLDYDDVAKAFKKGGCELLSKTYKNVGAKLKYRCSCGGISYISYDRFRIGHRCKKCGIEKSAKSRRSSLKEVRAIFKAGGCVCLEKRYQNTQAPMLYRCNCGRQAKISLRSFKSGSRCKNCGITKRANSQRYTLEQVKSIFSSAGCVLRATKYVSARTPLPYTCSCGRQAKIRIDHIQHGVKCAGCAGNQKLNIDVVAKAFTVRGCTLLSKRYKGNKQKLEYICDQGVRHTINYHRFSQGTRCSCRIKRRFVISGVRDYFTDQGCVLLESEFKNCRTPIRYVCECGNESKITFDNFSRGTRCGGCAVRKRNETRQRFKATIQNADFGQLTQQISERRKEIGSQ